MLFRRVMGKASFAKLADRTGQIQVFIQTETIGKEADDAFKAWDIGDIVGVEGRLFRTRTGELTVRAEKIRLLEKSLRPLPDKWHGLSDTETRYRQRYVDLIVNDAAREVFLLGKTRPNPAIQDNWIHTFLARDVEYRCEPLNAGTELTRVRLVPQEQIPALIEEGKITHSLVVVGFHWLGLRGRAPLSSTL
jgi:hypothetical protein